MKCALLLAFLLPIHLSLKAQSLQQKNDSVRLLEGVIIRAFAYNKPLSEVPASVATAGAKDFNRFNPISLLPTLNTIAGVRMEERSPGSYRLAIRGSSLRSPFGVRNVKFYWNGLPLTDGGGNTYLNLFDLNSIGRVEVIKGPGASLYGAGTGGVVLLNSQLTSTNQVQLAASGGSFGLQRYQTSLITGTEEQKFFINYAHQQADGYRQQTSMRRDAINVEGRFSLNAKNNLHATIFYTDLYYQTPGALTLAQYDADPSQARPATSTTKGAVEQQAAVYNKTIYSALNDDHQWNEKWSTRIGLFYSYTDFTNPTINNYERRNEYNYGGRTDTQYSFGKSQVKGKLTFGAEIQNFYSPLANYGNKLGVQDTLQYDDRLNSNFGLVFGQLELELPKKIFFTAGASASKLNYSFKRIGGNPLTEQTRNFESVFSPRLALLKKLTETISVFGSVSKGFSPPTLAEVRPSTGIYNNSLSPEQGISYEVGFRGSVMRKFSFDVVGYDFALAETIVSQKQANGADFFINAGNTSQRGVEAFLAWQSSFSSTNFSYLKIWTAANFTNYRFVNYTRDNVSYSNNQLTGSPANSITGGTDFSFFKKFYCNFTLNFVDKIPLNDANSFYSSDYLLIGSRLGYKKQLGRKALLEILAGIDNALDQRYSLGNDLNAVGNRYFNAAVPRNYYFGVKLLFNQ